MPPPSNPVHSILWVERLIQTSATKIYGGLQRLANRLHSPCGFGGVAQGFGVRGH